MKTMKYFMMGALLFGCSLGTMAQDGTPADVEAARNLVKNKPADYEKQMKNFISICQSGTEHQEIQFRSCLHPAGRHRFKDG